jgi:photosystem II stability/assembly factor-like uncharacterized protein
MPDFPRQYTLLAPTLIVLAIMLSAVGCSESGNEPTTPMLVPQPASLEFEAYSGSLAPNAYVNVRIRNIDSIAYRLSADQAWLDIPTGNRIAPDSFFVKIFPTNMTPGVNTATITLQSTNPVGITRTIPVTVDIGSVLQLLPRYFSFEATRESTAISDLYFVVTTNDPTSEFGFSVEPLAPWIALDSDTGTTPDTIFFNIDLSQATTRDQIGLIRVSSADVANPPQSVTCSLSVFSWLNQTSPLDKDLRGVHFHDPQRGWAAGILGGLDQNGYLVKTTDGGATWQLYPDLSLGLLQAIYFHDATNGWAVGADGLILHTNNGGDTWVEQNSGVAVDLWAVGFSTADSGIAVGRNGTAGYTTDGGATWHFTSDIIGYNLSDLSIIDSRNAWVVGNFGAILKTADGGRTWTVVSLGNYSDLWSVHFTDADNGWAVGVAGLTLYTADGGATWQTQTSNTDNTLLSVHFATSSVGWIVGRDGTILYTQDGGQTWEHQYSGIENWDLYDVYFVDESTGWVVGQFGTILYSPAGGN